MDVPVNEQYEKKLILAVAGAGKTTQIVERLNADSRALIITYTNLNVDNLYKMVNSKFGCIPNGVKVMEYYSFLYYFCFLPFGYLKWRPEGLNYLRINPKKRSYSKTDKRFYQDSGQRMYSNKLAELCRSKYICDIKARLEKYFKYIFVDEVQDFAGYDFNFLLELSDYKGNFVMLGDFYQHTFDTSRSGSVNKNLYNDYGNYIERFEKHRILTDTKSLSRSKRCLPAVCEFVASNLGIAMESALCKKAEVRELNDDEIANAMNDDGILKLFLQNNSKYVNVRCKDNWGNVKGITHNGDVCVVLNKDTYNKFKKNDYSGINPLTRNKLYVACTRATGNLYFVSEQKCVTMKIAS